ncbi:NAD(+) diphosphatase [Rhodococcus sp. PSBB049]|uniref:NAD(+) diphosphatase n=1 Tax=Rhodococcus sp. PSBB049 TaxID=2812863 RepID=UPI00197CFBE3|nr:NAD(+) diphosphatase [Rhodococcus sp. PSBB049]QSE72338.1 NAD(+) diphosphatase [Rhodococcus sp. PSBB049]
MLNAEGVGHVLPGDALSRPVAIRDNVTAQAEAWPNSRLLRVNGSGQVRLIDRQLILESAADYYSQPPAHAVLLGVVGTVHEWAVRDEFLTDGSTESADIEVGDLRSHGPFLDAVDAERYLTAQALLMWQDESHFCAKDGAPTTVTSGGWTRVCTACGREEYPRTDPAIICLVHDGADRVLLARQANWPTRNFSTLAGFVEAGESLESCVAREVAEEVGLVVSDVVYVGSQPWPFPRSLMLGFHAVADPRDQLIFRDGEICEAAWCTRAEVREALAAGDWTSSVDAHVLLPGKVSIARRMLEAWVGAENFRR